MPKSKFNKEKRDQIKIDLNMSMKERDQIKDPKKVIEVAKLQESRKRSRTLTQEDINRENAAKEAEALPKIGGVKVKVRPQQKQTDAGAPQQEEVQKTSKPGRTYAERKHQSEKLQQYREQLAVLTERANARVETIVNNGFQSRALDAALASRPSTRGSNEPLFNANLRTEKQIKTELARTMAFLSDSTSLSEGAENFTENFSAKGLFGGQYRAINGKGYSDEIDDDIGETTLDLYGKILAQAGGWERVIGYMKSFGGGLVEYGSEQLINSIYDMVVQLGTSDSAQERIINRGKEIVDQMVKDYQEMATKQRSGVDYGFLGYDDNSKEMQKYWAWKMAREGIK